MKSVSIIFFLIVSAFRISGEENVKFTLQSRIGGGSVGKPNYFPYQVGLFIKKKIDGKFASGWCGGSLISENIILTAGHCVNGATSVIISLGAHNRFIASEPGRVNIRADQKNIIIHEDYNKGSNLNNDIALIILPEKVILSNAIQTINLPRVSQKLNSLKDVSGVITGWGHTGNTPADMNTDKIRFLNRKIVSDDICEYFYNSYNRETQMCVDGSDKKGACHGDSGGPFVTQDSDGSQIIIGIASFKDPKKCTSIYPAAYTRVAPYLDWISNKTGIKLRM